MIIKALELITTLSLIALSTLVLFEACYRIQLIDFYSPELKAYNLEIKEKYDNTILCLGDSFTAGINSYPNYLKNYLDKTRVINSGLSGTGIIQANFIAEKRIKKFKPSRVIYQIYLGNDLFDINYPDSSKNLSIKRYLYWKVAEIFRSLSFLNYRIAQILSKEKETKYNSLKSSLASSEEFDIKKYPKRNKIYLRNDPYFIEKQVNLKGARAFDFKHLKKGIKSLSDLCTKHNCMLDIVLIPDAVQVSKKYLQRLEKIGAKFKDEKKILTKDYPFKVELNNYLKEQNMKNTRLFDSLDILKKEETKGKSVYFTNDPHLNYYGQEILAKSILKTLKLRGKN